MHDFDQMNYGSMCFCMKERKKNAEMCLQKYLKKEYLFCFRYPRQHDINNRNLLCVQ